MSDPILNEGIPADLHPFALDPLGKGKAIDAATEALHAVHVGMGAVIRADKQIGNKDKLFPHAVETSQNVLRHAGTSLKTIDAHIAGLEKKLNDALVPPAKEQKYSDLIARKLLAEKNPLTVAIAAANRGDLSLARALLDMPNYVSGVTEENLAQLRQITLGLAVPTEFAEYEAAVKAKARVQRGIDFTVDLMRGYARRYGADADPVNNLKNVKLMRQAGEAP